MKLLVVLETHFSEDEDGNVWSDRVVDYSYLKRYLKVFEEVYVCGRTTKDKKIQKMMVSGENVFFVPLPDFVGAKGLLKNYFKIRKKIQESIKKVDCVIYRAPTHISLFTYDIVLKNNKPLALEFMMAADQMIEKKGIMTKFLNFLIRKKAQKMCKKANGVSYVTEHILQKMYPCKALTSPSKNYFTASYSSIDLYDEDYFSINLNKEKPEILKLIHVGYMDSYRKGQHIAIQVVKKLIEKKINVRLTLVGDGKKRKEFENLAKELQISEYVKFTGAISDKNQKLEILRNNDLFIFPTTSEGLPRTILEAMAQSLPCISSPVDGIPELLENNYLIEPYDIDGYVKIIENMYHDWENTMKNAQRNFMHSKEYHHDKLEEKRTTFYRSLKELEEKNVKDIR